MRCAHDHVTRISKHDTPNAPQLKITREIDRGRKRRPRLRRKQSKRFRKTVRTQLRKLQRLCNSYDNVTAFVNAIATNPKQQQQQALIDSGANFTVHWDGTKQIVFQTKITSVSLKGVLGKHTPITTSGEAMTWS